MVMVKNSSDIQIIKIFVLTLFLLTVVLDYKSNATDIFCYHFYSSYYYPLSTKKLNVKTCIHEDINLIACKKCDSGSGGKTSFITPAINIYNLNYINTLNNYSSFDGINTRQRGIHPINGPPSESDSKLSLYLRSKHKPFPPSDKSFHKKVYSNSLQTQTDPCVNQLFASTGLLSDYFNNYKCPG
ncbi:MAG: hypothetical protein PHH93_11255, partial [Prolixibacteraceae bacterium]|nr:hypothetical protein [Prolixibacteraceae bacterium]